MIHQDHKKRALLSRRSGGSALLITLTMVTIVTGLVIGLMISIRLDRSASSSALERTRATAAAEYGVEQVSAQLLYYTSNTNRFWVSQPGRIVAGAEKDNTSTTTVDERKVLSVEVPLTSGMPSSSASSFGVLAPAKLNIKTLDGGTDRYIVSNGTTDAMRLRWVYVRQDGTEDTAESPVLTNKTNPIVSRYAYWTDDESTKINLNLAWKRDQTSSTSSFPLRHPSHVDLGGLVQTSGTDPLSDTDKALLHTRVYGTGGHPFNNSAEAKQLDGDIPAIMDLNKFGVTHYNSSPQAPTDRFYLTTDRKLMNSLQAKGLIPVVTTASNTTSATTGLPNFIDIRTNEDYDPGYLPYIWDTTTNAYRMNKSILALRAQLLRTDWPALTGKSLIDKWYGSGLTTLQKNLLAEQVAMNIIDYVRLRESKAKLALPIVAKRASLTLATSTYSFTGYEVSPYKGTSLQYLGTPYFDEIQVDVTPGKMTTSTTSKWIMPGRSPVITEMAMVIDSTPVTQTQSGIVSGTWTYWPTMTNSSTGQQIPPGLSGTTLSGVVLGGNAGPVPLYRCKLYVEVYLPKYDGLSSNFAIDFSATGSAAWPGGTAELPPTDVIAHTSSAAYGSYTVETKGKWFMGFPEEASSYPDYLIIDSSKAANTVNLTGSTDHRNHLAYYARDEAGTRVFPTSFGGVYTVGTTGTSFQPFTWINYCIPLIRPSEFVGGSGGGVLTPGHRIVIAKEYFRTGPLNLRPKVKMRVSLSFGIVTNSPAQGGLSIGILPPSCVAMAPMWDSVEVPLQEVSASEYDSNNTSGLSSLQINDPRLGADPSKWEWKASTFGAENTNSDIGKAPSASSSVAQQDTDSGGKVSGYSVLNTAMPADATNSSGYVESLGELGFIHTGMSYDATYSVPWRTLRLQPNNYSSATTQVPDWALLDAFAILPLDSSTYSYSSLLAPHGTSRGGLVNLQTSFYPSGFGNEKRITGIVGLLLGAKKNSSSTFSYTDAQTVANNIADFTLATGSNPGKSYNYDKVLDSIGEVVELKGVADSGEESEEAARALIGLGTNQSNTFTIYAVGQALKQAPDGSLSITAERRRQVMLERYVDDTDTRVRAVYSKDLLP